MTRWPRYISLLGAVFVALAAGRSALAVFSGDAQLAAVIDMVLISVPGIVLWYVARWLPETEFDPELYPRVVAWSLGGIGVMFAYNLLRVAHPGVVVDFTPGTQAIGLAIGSLGGLAIGIREAEAVSRASELQSRNAELRRREHELERQNERLDEFTDVVSHDLRNPLNVAQGRVELAREDVDAAVSHHLQSVARAHDRMASLIEDLLALARQGDVVDEFEPVDLERTVRACWANVATGDATLETDSPGVVLADETRLQQVLENLLRNAVEHGSTSPGSQPHQDAVEHGSTSNQNTTRSDAAVAHGGEHVTVTVGTLADDDGFYVADDGPGIPAGQRDAVFDHGHTSSPDGTGFGLAIVERVSEAHDWSVSVTASESGGARFEFTGVEFAT